MACVRCQLAAICCAKDDLAGNLAAHLHLVADAASAGRQLVLFPEMSPDRVGGPRGQPGAAANPGPRCDCPPGRGVRRPASGPGRSDVVPVAA